MSESLAVLKAREDLRAASRVLAWAAKGQEELSSPFSSMVIEQAIDHWNGAHKRLVQTLRVEGKL